MAPKIQFDLSSFDRRQLPLLVGTGLLLVATIIGLFLVLGSNDQSEIPAPPGTVEGTVLLSATPSVLPSPTIGAPTSTIPQPATATLAPYEYVVQPGDTLYYILGLFGYRELDVVPQVLEMNSMSAENDLFADQTLLIPRQTPTFGPTTTPSPTPGEGTPTVDPNITPELTDCSPENRCMSPDSQYWLHTVREGETCAQVAFLYDTTVSDVIRDNNLTQNCIIRPGQILRAFIRVTLTPTLTPTGGPNSTPTATPTLMPPPLLAPANGATISRNQQVVLQWVTTQVLSPGAYYMVILTNMGSGNELRWTTQDNIYRLPDDLQPGSGQAINFTWQVMIVNGQSTESLVISGQTSGYTFTWGG